MGEDGQDAQHSVGKLLVVEIDTLFIEVQGLPQSSSQRYLEGRNDPS